MKWIRYLSRISRIAPIVVIIMLFLSLHPVLAKGPPDKLIISGPGTPGEVTVTDVALLADVGLGSLEEFSTISPPAGLVQSYEVTRYFKNGEIFTPFDRLHYYVDPTGGRGYIFYDGLSFDHNSGWSEYDGKWFRASAAGDIAMRALLKHIGAAPKAGILSATGSAATPVRELAALACGLVIACLLCVVSGVMARATAD